MTLDETASLYTRDKAVMRKLDKLVADFPDTYSLIGQDEVTKYILLYKFAQNYGTIKEIRYINPNATQIFVTATIG